MQNQGQRVKGLEYTLTERFLYSLILNSLLVFSYIYLSTTAFSLAAQLISAAQVNWHLPAHLGEL